MPLFLFRFGFETPLQRRNNAAHGWDDEDSEAVFIECDAPEEALAWGREIAERFVANLFSSAGEPAPSWQAEGFAHWIEDNAEAVAHARASGIPSVRVGEYPK